ncbi:MAG: hypothetical protein FWE37_02605 [Spirochaetaceae bacterium]|nr:hypothetical protein [Spirochaetaceae bacterium]
MRVNWQNINNGANLTSGWPSISANSRQSIVIANVPAYMPRIRRHFVFGNMILLEP